MEWETIGKGGRPMPTAIRVQIELSDGSSQILEGELARQWLDDVNTTLQLVQGKGPDFTKYQSVWQKRPASLNPNPPVVSPEPVVESPEPGKPVAKKKASKKSVRKKTTKKSSKKKQSTKKQEEAESSPVEEERRRVPVEAARKNKPKTLPSIW
jgi:hypothetical protein